MCCSRHMGQKRTTLVGWSGVLLWKKSSAREQHRQDRLKAKPGSSTRTWKTSRRPRPTQFDTRTPVHQMQRDSLLAVPEGTALGTAVLQREHEGVLLGTRGAGALGTLAGSRADQADEICELFHRISTYEPFAYPDPTNTPCIGGRGRACRIRPRCPVCA